MEMSNSQTTRWLREFFPEGTQQASPGGISLDVSEIIAIQSSEEPGHGFLEIHLPSGAIKVTFHRNTDSAPARIYEIHRRLWRARQESSNAK
jgi:hypothetical protein